MQAVAGLAQFSLVGAVAELQVLEEALAVAQHHDAASGTAKQHVTFDYQRRIANGVLQSDKVLSAGIAVLAGAPGTWQRCARLNETVCSITQAGAGTVTVSVWNPVAQARAEFVSLPVSSNNVTVTDSTGKQLVVQVSPAGETVTNYHRNTGEAGLVATFEASLPAVGLSMYSVTQGASSEAMESGVVKMNEDVVIDNEHLSLTFSSLTGMLSSMTNKQTGTSISVSQSLCYYQGNQGDQASGQSSGAYIFRPDASQECILVSSNASISVFKGALYQQVTQVIGVQQDGTPWLTQTLRLGAGQRHAQLELTVGEIPILDLNGNLTAQKCVSWRQTADCSPDGPRQPDLDKSCDTYIPGSDSGFCECIDGRKAGLSSCGHPGITCEDQCRFHSGKEIVSRFNTSIASASVLLTDSNGRDMLYRQRDWRPSWNLSQTEPIAGNYYPINSAVAIKDASAQLTLLVDRAQGAGSVADGVLEVMIHRRLLVDDSRGVGEPLNETQFTGSYAGPFGGQATGPGLVVRARHWLSLEPPSNASAVWRPLADQMFARPVLTFGSGSAVPSFSALAQPLPDNIQLTTLQALSEGQILLRLSHQFGIDEDDSLSAPVDVDLSALFNPKVLSLTMAVERSLTNNQDKSHIVARRQLDTPWKTEIPTRAPHPWRNATFDFLKSPVVTLGPLEVKTFVLTVKSTMV